jgi:hypothetical protein
VSKAWSADRELSMAGRRDSLGLKPRWALPRWPGTFLLASAMRLLPLPVPLVKGEGLLDMVLPLRPGAAQGTHLPDFSWKVFLCPAADGRMAI